MGIGAESYVHQVPLTKDAGASRMKKDPLDRIRRDRLLLNHHHPLATSTFVAAIITRLAFFASVIN